MRGIVRLAVAVTAAVAVLSAAVAASSMDVGRAAKLCTSADEALRNGKVEEGRKLFQKALETVPDFPDAHLGLGQMAMMEKRYPDALQEFEAARDAYSRFGDVLYDVRMQQFNKVQDEITKLQDSLAQIRSETGRTGGGGTSLDQSKIENRIQQLQGVPQPKKSESSEPPAEVYFLIGNAHFRMNEFGPAVLSYEQCVKANPKHLAAYTNLALALWKSGKLEDARGALARAEAAGLTPDAKLKAELAAAK